MNDISTDLSDWESEDDVSERDEVVARGQRMRKLCEGRTLEALAREMIGEAIGEDCSDLSSGDVIQIAQLLADYLAAIRLLEAEPREPDGWLAYVRYDLGGPDRPMIECDKERLLAALSRIGGPQPEVGP